MVATTYCLFVVLYGCYFIIGFSLSSVSSSYFLTFSTWVAIISFLRFAFFCDE